MPSNCLTGRHLGLASEMSYGDNTGVTMDSDEARWRKASAAYVRKHRKRLGLTQKDVGEAAGISRETVLRVEKVDLTVKDSNVIDVLRALGGPTEKNDLLRHGDDVRSGDIEDQLQHAQHRIAVLTAEYIELLALVNEFRLTVADVVTHGRRSLGSAGVDVPALENASHDRRKRRPSAG
jgi:transcriptional regulator with XRE-family HTH domain